MSNDHGREPIIKTGPPPTGLEDSWKYMTDYLKANPDNLYQRQFTGKYGEQLLFIRWDPDLQLMITEHCEPDPNDATDGPGIMWGPCGTLARTTTFTEAIRHMIAAIAALRDGEELTFINEKGEPITWT